MLVNHRLVIGLCLAVSLLLTGCSWPSFRKQCVALQPDMEEWFSDHPNIRNVAVFVAVVCVVAGVVVLYLVFLSKEHDDDSGALVVGDPHRLPD